MSKAEAKDQEVAEKQATSAYVVFRALDAEAHEELERGAAALAFSGLAAGLSIGFSVVAEAMLTHYLRQAGDWKPLVTKLGYSVGFLIVVRGRQQLFTENTLTPVLPLLHHRDRRTLMLMLRLWAIVLVTNLVGTALFAAAMAYGPIFEPAIKDVFTQLAQETIGPPFGTILLRGVFAGWLIALMVWLLPVAESGRVAVILILTYLIGISHFSHVVAGSTEAFYLAWIGEIAWTSALSGFVLPALIGNVIGGVALVAALNYAQAAPGDEEGEE
ncbi:MAG: transporter [Phycisphaerales bacterium]|nr:transporter [Phycisphaerales bacterium]